MKKYVLQILILTVVVLSLTLTASDVSAQSCQHIHQLSKKLISQVNVLLSCRLCVVEKSETFVIKQRIMASISADCGCDETGDAGCGSSHGHPNSANGDFEPQGCVWEELSSGIPDNSMFDATITRWIKYCKDGTDNPFASYPRAGHHGGVWKIVDSLSGGTLARGILQGLDGVDPSFERPYTASDRSAHSTLPGGQPNNPGPDFCDGADCYIPGWQSGVILGLTTDLFFRYQCPPPGTYTLTEVAIISDCPLGGLFVINDSVGRQICVTPTARWIIKALYSGGSKIDPTKHPCDQWSDNSWSVRLEGVIYINRNFPF